MAFPAVWADARVDRERFVFAVDPEIDGNRQGGILNRERRARYRRRGSRGQWQNRAAGRARHEGTPVETGCKLLIFPAWVGLVVHSSLRRETKSGARLRLTRLTTAMRSCSWADNTAP